MAENISMKGWERQPDGTIKAVHQFDMEKEIMKYHENMEKKKVERQKRLQLEKQKELEKRRSMKKSISEREISK